MSAALTSKERYAAQVASNPVGAPPKYDPSYCERATKYCRIGATNATLARQFDVDELTISRWIREHDAFRIAVNEGRYESDANVAGALYTKAIGAEWIEQQAIKIKVGKDQERVEVVDVVKRAPPDTAAAFIWLKNRQPQHWRDKIDVQFGVEALTNAAGKLLEVMRDVASSGFGGAHALLERMGDNADNAAVIEGHAQSVTDSDASSD